jgi:hypothetical protein
MLTPRPRRARAATPAAQSTTAGGHAPSCVQRRKQVRPACCIPIWYHFGMSKQIAVRLSDQLVEFVDEVVGSGQGASRAAVVTRALERERRRMVAMRDAEILASVGPDPELEGLAGYAARVRVED